MTITKTQLRTIVDAIINAVESAESGHPLAILITETVRKAADTVGVDAIAAELAKFGFTVTD